jgi:uncharacterized OsmC-like protein
MTQSNVVQNVDLDKLTAFRSFLKDNPDKGQLKLEARALYEGQVGRSTVHIGPYELDGNRVDRETRHYTIPFGAWREVEEAIGVEGPTDRYEPVEMALAATAACVINSISFNTARLGIDVQDMEITVRSNVDPRVLFAVKGPEEHGPCLGTVEYDVKVKGNISDEELETIKQLCEHSPVYGLLAEAIPLKANVTRD